MPQVTLLNQSGENVGNIDLNDQIFGIEPNEHALHQVVTAQRASMRQGTHNTKTRGEVRGGGRKPWRQKGTGRARHGSIRSPIWTGGGTTFGPRPRSYKKKINRKVRLLALKSALSSKLQKDSLFVLEDLSFEAPKTKKMVEVLNSLSVGNKALIILPEYDENVARSANNIPGATVRTVDGASVYDIITSDALITTKRAVETLEEVLA